ncbi:MAG: hypothetical protein ACRDSP_20690 [Pseudonocardiaceae bacterium]
MSHPLDEVPRVVWRPVHKVVQFVRQVRDAVSHVADQMREVAQLMLRILDGVTLQMTRMRTHSQMEIVFGPLTWSIASGVVIARPGSGTAG